MPDTSDESSSKQTLSDTDSSEEDSRKRKLKKSKPDKKKKSSKDKKKRHHKKEKKHSKKKKRYSSSSESESSDPGEETWVETTPASLSMKQKSQQKSDVPKTSGFQEPNLEPGSGKDNAGWENLDSFIPTYSSDKKKKRETAKEWEKLRRTDRPGQHSRELNPYWKDGGTGLPSQEQDMKTSQVASSVGDGGLSWLRRAYQRAKEQAKEENKSLEEIAAERWGSLANFYELLEEAERKASGSGKSHSRSDSRHYKESSQSNNSRFKKPMDCSDEERDRRSPQHYHHSDRRRYEKRGERDKRSSWKKDDSIPTTSKPPSSRRVELEEHIKPKIETPKSISIISSTAHDSDPEENEEPQPLLQSPDSDLLDDKEMNQLSAKMFKAELMGNQDLVQQLKSKLARAKEAREEFIKGGGDFKSKTEDPKVITKIIMDSRPPKRTNKPGSTHEEGKRVRYFADDDKKTLQSMFHSEKTNTAENENELFLRLAGKGMKSNPNDEYDLDDFFTDKASSSKAADKERERGIRKIVEEEKTYNKTLENCDWCFDGKRLEKNIIISIGQKSFLAVPPFQSLTEGHCIICPMAHVTASTELDEDVWAEMQKFRRSLVEMFKADDKDVVIFEYAVFLKRLPHMYIECVPLPKEVGELAPIYFKKAIQECETEWSQNKKLIDLRNKDVRRGVPKGLPYFAVDFGLDSGFAHVIEDEIYFPRNFAQEVIGGMLELDHSVWRKQTPDSFTVKRDKVMNFLKVWEAFDCTRE